MDMVPTSNNCRPQRQNTPTTRAPDCGLLFLAAELVDQRVLPLLPLQPLHGVVLHGVRPPAHTLPQRVRVARPV